MYIKIGKISIEMERITRCHGKGGSHRLDKVAIQVWTTPHGKRLEDVKKVKYIEIPYWLRKSPYRR